MVLQRFIIKIRGLLHLPNPHKSCGREILHPKTLRVFHNKSVAGGGNDPFMDSPGFNGKRPPLALQFRRGHLIITWLKNESFALLSTNQGHALGANSAITASKAFRTK